jgi:hypothetical protein
MVSAPALGARPKLLTQRPQVRYFCHCLSLLSLSVSPPLIRGVRWGAAVSSQTPA